MSKRLRLGIAMVLLAVAGQAAALGLGRIEVKSRLGEPLLAEIPVISADPSELEQLQARLASPETFRRVGLEPPVGAAADLQFSLARDAQGRPVIRVTTLVPVTQAQLDFLVEVDWGQGRLVREYAAVVGTASTATAAAQPAISAPQVDPAASVVRPAEPAVTSEPLPSAPAAQPETGQVAVAPPPPEAPAPTAAGDSYGPVARGQTLSGIVSELGLAAGQSRDQAMLAVLRANPEAFIGENINLIRRGAVLRVPDAAQIASIPRAEAASVVREQMQHWRERARTVRQPVAPADAANATAAAAPAQPAERQSPARPQQQARLEIVPPGDGGATATRSGTSAGGEGTMLQQQLQQRDEEIAARTAEITELKERVAELEGLQQQQQALLALKDTELAAAQQRLAQANAGTSAGQEPAASPMPWILGGLGLLGAALLAWLFGRRRAGRVPVPAEPRPGRFDSATLAAAVPASATAAAEPSQTEEPVVAPAPQPAAAPPASPTWHSPRIAATEVVLEPTPHGDAAAPSADAGGIEDALQVAAPPRPVVSPAHQLQLAQAYIDLGDDASARELLRGVLRGEDAQLREQAERMLRELD